MAMLASIQRPLKKVVPASRGVAQNALTGVGFDKLGKAVDSVVGSPVQRIISFPVPFLGTVTLIDVMNYLVHANGLRLSKNGFIAVAAARFVDGTLPAIGSISLPGSVNAGQGSSVAAGVPGAPI